MTFLSFLFLRVYIRRRSWAQKTVCLLLKSLFRLRRVDSCDHASRSDVLRIDSGLEESFFFIQGSLLDRLFYSFYSLDWHKSIFLFLEYNNLKDVMWLELCSDTNLIRKLFGKLSFPIL